MEIDPKDLAEQIERDRKAIAELEKKLNDLVEEQQKRELESLQRRIKGSKKGTPT